MISKKSVGHLTGVCYAAVFGALIIGGIRNNWPDMSIAVLLSLSAALLVAFYFAGRWIAVREEENKNLPTSSRELKKQRKEFYDWLDSHGRPQSRRRR
jgi:hypothetical protein